MSTVVVKNNTPKLITALDKITLDFARKSGAFLEVKLVERIEQQDSRWPPLKEETIRRKGSSLAWIDTGELMGLITYHVTSNSGAIEVQVGIFNHEKGFIATILEFGAPGVNIPERPLFRPVIIENKDELEKLVTDWLMTELRKYYLK